MAVNRLRTRFTRDSSLSRPPLLSEPLRSLCGGGVPPRLGAAGAGGERERERERASRDARGARPLTSPRPRPPRQVRALFGRDRAGPPIPPPAPLGGGGGGGALLRFGVPGRCRLGRPRELCDGLGSIEVRRGRRA